MIKAQKIQQSRFMNSKLHPMWVVGFVDGEGCFRASIIQNAKLRFGMQIQIEFVVVQHVRDKDLLYRLKNTFQCGNVTPTKGFDDVTNNTARFRVRKLVDLCEKVIPFFEQHSLKTKKNVEFLRFRDLCYLLNQQVHLTEEGFARCFHLAKTLPYSNQ